MKDWDLKELQKVLDQTKKGIKKLDNDIYLLKLEETYQKYISQFSKAYVSGSDWYVGDSIIEHIKKTPVNNGLLSFLFLISNRKL